MKTNQPDPIFDPDAVFDPYNHLGPLLYEPRVVVEDLSLREVWKRLREVAKLDEVRLEYLKRCSIPMEEK